MGHAQGHGLAPPRSPAAPCHATRSQQARGLTPGRATTAAAPPMQLVGEAKYLQNNPPELVPMEDRAVRHILDVLSPFSEDSGGPLRIQHVTFVEGRGNIIVT